MSSFKILRKKWISFILITAATIIPSAPPWKKLCLRSWVFQVFLACCTINHKAPIKAGRPSLISNYISFVAVGCVALLGPLSVTLSLPHSLLELERPTPNIRLNEINCKVMNCQFLGIGSKTMFIPSSSVL